jgi:hypothetical protein
MLTRFDFERAFVDPASDLNGSICHLLHVLAMRLDKDQFTILPRYQPSLTELARDMHCNRRTAMRRLSRAEASGWIVRTRPSVHDARTKHARTQYTLRIPPGYLEARGIKAAELEAGNRQPGGTTPPELGTGKREASGTMPHRSSESSASSDGDLDLIISEIEKRTGKRPGKLAAVKIRGELLGKASSPVRNTQAYLRSSIGREPDPWRWLPTPTPPPFSEYDLRAGTHTEGESHVTTNSR